MGAPGKVVRELDQTAVAQLRASAANYMQNAARYRNTLKEL